MIKTTSIIPLLLFTLSTAIIVGIIWGLSLLAIFSFFIAKEQNKKPWKVIAEHVGIGLLVVIITHSSGDWIAKTLK